MPRRDTYAPKRDLGYLISVRGSSVAAIERRARVARGTLSRLLHGKRGKALSLALASRLARAMNLRLDAFAAAYEHTRVELEDRSERRRAAQEARLLALRG